MRWMAFLCLAALPALATENKIAVAPIEGVLGRADAAALEEAVRTEVRGLDLFVVPGAPESIAAAADSGANHAITAKAVRLEGALAVTLTLVKTDDGQRKGTERLVGYTLEDLKGEARKKVPRLLRAGLGLAGGPSPTAPPTPTPTTTAIPTTTGTATTTATPTTTATARPTAK